MTATFFYPLGSEGPDEGQRLASVFATCVPSFRASAEDSGPAAEESLAEVCLPHPASASRRATPLSAIP